MKKTLTVRIFIMLVACLLALPPASALACGANGGGNGGDSDSSMESGRFADVFVINRGLSRSVARTQDNISRAVRGSWGSSSFTNPGISGDTVDVGRTEPVVPDRPMSRQELREFRQEMLDFKHNWAERERLAAVGWDWATTSAEWTQTGAKVAGWAVVTYATAGVAWGYVAPTSGVLAAGKFATKWGAWTTLAGSAASSTGDYLAGNDPKVIENIGLDQLKRKVTGALPPGVDIVTDFALDAARNNAAVPTQSSQAHSATQRSQAHPAIR